MLFHYGGGLFVSALRSQAFSHLVSAGVRGQAINTNQFVTGLAVRLRYYGHIALVKKYVPLSFPVRPNSLREAIIAYWRTKLQVKNG